MRKKISIILVLLMCTLLVFTGCSGNVETVDTTTSKTNSSETNSASESDVEDGEKILNEFDFKTAAEKQMEMPKDGDTVAVRV